jgi:hypothetical protein
MPDAPRRHAAWGGGLMPAAQDHYRLCLAALGEDARFAGPETIGAQGPDPFYFYGLLPWKPRRGRTRSRALADWLHLSAPARVFLPLAEEARSMPAGEERDISFRFLRGLVFHYLLDRAAHPYVYSRTGFPGPGEDERPFQADHARFEAALCEAGRDSIARRGGARGQAVLPALTLREVEPRSMLRAERRWLRTADELFLRAFPGRYAPGLYPAAFRDMVDALAILWDPAHGKRRFIAVLGARDTIVHAMIQPVPPPERGDLDYLNEGRGEWLDPATGERRLETMAELVARALGDAERVSPILWSIEEGRADPPASSLEAFLGELDHRGCQAGTGMRYYASAYRPGLKGRPVPPRPREGRVPASLGEA